MSGLSRAGHRAALEALTPSGTNVYAALFTLVPNLDGSGGAEVSGPWYARVAHSAWKFEILTEETVCRVNKGAVTFAAVGLGDPDVDVEAWGIFDASTGGDLLAFGLAKQGGSPAVVTLTQNDQARFSDGELSLCLDNAAEELAGSLSGSLTLEDTMQTLDATPTNFPSAVNSMVDAQGVKVIAEITGKSGTKHYSRRVVKKYDRDDGGSGTALWNTDEIQTDGVVTKVGFATATADLVIVGDNIFVEVIGEAATTIDWQSIVTVIRDDV